MSESKAQIILFTFAGILFLAGIYFLDGDKGLVILALIVPALFLALFSGIGPSTLTSLFAKWGAEGGEIKFNRYIPTEQEREIALEAAKDEPSAEIKQQAEKLAEEAEKRPEEKRSAEDYLVLATEKYVDKEYDEALKMLYAGLSLNPEDKRIQSSFLYKQGNVFFEIGSMNLAEIYFKKAIQADPTHSMPHNNLGVVYSEQKKYGLAEASYKEAIRLDPKHSLARSNLGNTYFNQEKYDLAEVSYKEAIRLDPENSEAHNNLGIVYSEQKKYGLAEASYKEAIRLDPKDSELHNNLGVLYFNQKKYDLAEASYRKTLELDPENTAARGNLELLEKKREEDSGG